MTAKHVSLCITNTSRIGFTCRPALHGSWTMWRWVGNFGVRTARRAGCSCSGLTAMSQCTRREWAINKLTLPLGAQIRNEFGNVLVPAWSILMGQVSAGKCCSGTALKACCVLSYFSWTNAAEGRTDCSSDALLVVVELVSHICLGAGIDEV